MYDGLKKMLSKSCNQNRLHTVVPRERAKPNNMLFRDIHACNKTIEESKEMAITKVRIIVTSKREGKVFRKVTGVLLGCWKCSIS